MGATAIVEDVSKVAPVDPAKAKTLPRMTKYEFDTLIGLRAMHLSRGAPALVDLPPGFKIQSNIEWRRVAIRELREGRMPYMVRRPLPNGEVEFWRIQDLDLVAVESLLEDDSDVSRPAAA